MSSREFGEWIAFGRLEPDPDDARTARMCANVRNAAGGRGRGVPFKEADFLPKRGVGRMSHAEIGARLLAIPSFNAAYRAARKDH